MPKKDAPMKLTAKSINTNPWVKMAAPPAGAAPAPKKPAKAKAAPKK